MIAPVPGMPAVLSAKLFCGGALHERGEVKAVKESSEAFSVTLHNGDCLLLNALNRFSFSAGLSVSLNSVA